MLYKKKLPLNFNKKLIGSPIIVALDYSNIHQAIEFSQKVSPHQCKLKIGNEMFTYAGPFIIHELHQRGFDIFLDLKFYDIPNTITRSIISASKLGVWMINIHAIGGTRMLLAAQNARLSLGDKAPILIAVTVLTSMKDVDLYELGINSNISNYVTRLAILTQKCGLDGVVCSAWEAAQLRINCGKEFIIVTPGIRLDHNININDQYRVMTPLKAIQSGVNFLVIGRPVTQSTNPSAVLTKILQKLNYK